MKNKKVYLVLGLCISLSLSGCGGIFKLKDNINRVQEVVSAVTDRQNGSEEKPSESESEEWPSESEEWPSESISEEDGSAESSSEEESSSEAVKPDVQTAREWKYGDRLIMNMGQSLVVEDGMGGTEILDNLSIGNNGTLLSAVSFKDDVLYAVNRAEYDVDGVYHGWVDIFSATTGQQITSVETSGIVWYVEDDGITYYYSDYEDDAWHYHWEKVKCDDEGTYSVKKAHKDRSKAMERIDGNLVTFYGGTKWTGANDNFYSILGENDVNEYNDAGDYIRTYRMENPVNYVVDLDEKGILFSYSDSSDGYLNTVNKYIYLNLETLEERVIYSGSYADEIYFNECAMTNGRIYYFLSDSSEFGCPKSTAYVYDVAEDATHKIYEVKHIPGLSYDEQLGQNMFVANGNRCLFMDTNGKVAYERIMDENYNITDASGVIKEFSIQKYGEVSYIADSIYADAIDKDVYEYYVERFQFTTDDAGVDRINEILDGYAQYVGNYATEAGANTLADLENGFFEYGAYTLECTLSRVRELGSKYYGVDYNGYEYWGGAHGMPFLNYMLFDRTSGELVRIQDLYGGTEEEFKDIVARYTVDDWMNNNDNGYFGWESEDAAYNAVYETANFEMLMSFEEDCLDILYPPYELGPFASGYIIVSIPYSELGITIE